MMVAANYSGRRMLSAFTGSDVEFIRYMFQQGVEFNGEQYFPDPELHYDLFDSLVKKGIIEMAGRLMDLRAAGMEYSKDLDDNVVFYKVNQDKLRIHE